MSDLDELMSQGESVDEIDGGNGKSRRIDEGEMYLKWRVGGEIFRKKGDWTIDENTIHLHPRDSQSKIGGYHIVRWKRVKRCVIKINGEKKEIQDFDELRVFIEEKRRG